MFDIRRVAIIIIIIICRLATCWTNKTHTHTRQARTSEHAENTIAIVSIFSSLQCLTWDTHKWARVAWMTECANLCVCVNVSYTTSCERCSCYARKQAHTHTGVRHLHGELWMKSVGAIVFMYSVCVFVCASQLAPQNNGTAKLSRGGGSVGNCDLPVHR